MKRTVIADIGPMNSPVYTHLQPLVDFLLASGNELSHAFMWGSNRDGYYCHLAKPIDFQALEKSFIIPRTVHFIPERDTIYCERSGSIIQTFSSPTL
jgi:hypothetical protein